MQRSSPSMALPPLMQVGGVVGTEPEKTSWCFLIRDLRQRRDSQHGECELPREYRPGISRQRLVGRLRLRNRGLRKRDVFAKHSSGFGADSTEENIDRANLQYGEVTYGGMERLYDALELRKDDVFYDLGCGVGKRLGSVGTVTAGDVVEGGDRTW
eukprot:Skav233593  [mRNA]  locus=scaffold2520:635359:643157:- [translate_table: standard]